MNRKVKTIIIMIFYHYINNESLNNKMELISVRAGQITIDNFDNEFVEHMMKI